MSECTSGHHHLFSASPFRSRKGSRFSTSTAERNISHLRKGQKMFRFGWKLNFFKVGGVFHIGRAAGDEGGFEPPPSAVGRWRECRRLRFSSEDARDCGLTDRTRTLWSLHRDARRRRQLVWRGDHGKFPLKTSSAKESFNLSNHYFSSFINSRFSHDS